MSQQLENSTAGKCDAKVGPTAQSWNGVTEDGNNHSEEQDTVEKLRPRDFFSELEQLEMSAAEFLVLA